MDHWLQNPLPAIGDSGLIFVTKDNVDIDPGGDRRVAVAVGDSLSRTIRRQGATKR